MPPKKVATSKTGGAFTATAVDEDLTDVHTLPPLNEFVFISLFAFKYRRNQERLEQFMVKHFNVLAEGETAEASKRNKTILLADLLNQAKAKNYLTEEEADHLAKVDPIKVRQVLARTTNEILASITVPLRRIKLEEADRLREKLEKISDDTERSKVAEAQKTQASALELTVWLKDFPRSAEDFKELRRSGAQHQPEIEVAIQGLFMVEEQFTKDVDEDGGLDIPNRNDSTLSNAAAETLELEKSNAFFKREDRIQAFNDLAYINKFARNCHEKSSMRLLTVQKFKFAGPDPPAEPIKKEEVVIPVEEIKAAPSGPGAKSKKEEVVVEIELTEQEKAELKLFSDFMIAFVAGVEKVKADLSEYRGLIHPEHGAERVALWPKNFSQNELLKMRQAEEERQKKEGEAEEERRRQEEEKKAVAAPAKKGVPPPAAKPADNRTQSRGAMSSADGSKQALRSSVMADILKKQKLISQDDGDRNFSFATFDRLMTEMDSASTNIGGILAAMVYQIEQDNKKANPTGQRSHHGQSVHKEPQSTKTHSVASLNPNLNSIDVPNDKAGAEKPDKNKLESTLDDIYNKLVIEQGVVQTDYSHQFRRNKVAEKMIDSPYQGLYHESDQIGIHDGKFTFMDGQTNSTYENRTLQRMDLPGVNERFKMPAKATRTQAERESDTNAILKRYPNVTHQGKRLVVLKAFEELLKSENPEREYEFQQRNFTEEMDPNTFRQVLVEGMRLCCDVNTLYFDKEDALLLALNFKNPPGRLLRRQWTYPIKTLPDIATWRRFVKDEKCMINLPVIDIPVHKVGLLRTNQKFCFPCDNSVIRVDKHNVGGRRFGASVIIKDNLVFGVRESEAVVKEKVPLEDELLNQESKKASKRNCEFWIEFENKARLHIAMLEPVTPQSNLIPPQINNARLAIKRAELGSITQNDTIFYDGEGATASVNQQSQMKKSSIIGSSMIENSGDHKTIESRKIADDGQDGKTLTIDHASSQEKFLAQQDSAKTKSQTNLPLGSDYQPDQGASMTFTYREGLIVQVLPNGNVQQTIVKNKKITKKNSVLVNENQEESSEDYRVITRNAQVIRYLKDGNQIIYFPDGTITFTDHRRGIWRTTNHFGVVRERNLRTGVVKDEMQRLRTHEKIDPETNAVVEIREDGLLRIKYPDRRTLLVLPDHSEILITKTGPLEEGSAVTTTIFKKEGYAPVRITSDPVKARAGTIIGLGGTDALMGKDSIMERSFGGLISETYLPDKSVVQTYLEKQELPGYNKFSTSLIHLVKRYDFSMIKIRQDGEVVVITANERNYLNSIGKEMIFGVNDYDYFFELFGVPNERRSGVYTANLEQGRIWTEDEEGNHFIIYANGDSTEKLSVSFNLDQMIEGIDNKEPVSPRIKDGEYIEDECKFLPPPKTVSHPRLFLVKESGATEFMNKEQVEYMFMCNSNAKDMINSKKEVNVDNEKATSHFFMRIQQEFNPTNHVNLSADSIPRLPQVLEMVNQTVAIANEPESSSYLWRKVLEFPVPTDEDLEKFEAAVAAKNDMRAAQAKQTQKLKIEMPALTKSQLTNQCRIMLRMARQRGVDVQKLIGDEFKQVKIDDRDQRRQKILETLDDHFRPETEQRDAQSN